MSGMRRVDGLFVSKSKYGCKQIIEEEEINLQEEVLLDNENSNVINIKDESKEEKSNNEIINKLELNFKIDENFKLSLNEEGKNEEEIKINQNELENALKELDEMGTNSSRDESQISYNEETDKHSILLKNIDKCTSVEEIEQFFKNCGDIKKVSIMINKYTGNRKGYAIVEFAGKDAKFKALDLNNTLLRGKQIRVIDKNKNISDYAQIQNKNSRYQTYLTNNSIRHKYSLDSATSQITSHIGPLKAKVISQKSFEPY